MCSGSQLILALFASICVFELRRADEPALARILDQRIFLGPPAERIVVQVLLLMEQQAALLQLADDVLVGILDPAALIVGRFGGELAVGRRRRRSAAGPAPSTKRACSSMQHVVVDFAERWRLMNDAGAAVGGDELGRARRARRRAARRRA